MPSAVVIANPKAGRGRAEAAITRVEEFLGAAGHDVRCARTERPSHATELAQGAGGSDLAVAVGGDGTVHEVVNGLMAIDEANRPALGVVPVGSGCDYVRTFEIPSDLDAAVAVLVGGVDRTVDVGRLRCQSDGAEMTRYFANIAEAGIGPEVVDRATRLPRLLGPAMYFVSFWLTLPRFKRRRSSLKLDGEPIESEVTNLVVAIGRVFGGGMRVAPHADPSDGVFDVQVQAGSKLDYVRAIPKVYKGTHVPHPTVTEVRAAEVHLTCDPPAMIEADGEVLGHTPATFSVQPAALQLRVPKTS